MSKNTKYIIGIVLLFMALLFMAFGAGFSWGISGASWAAGVTLMVYGAGMFAE